jgi:kinesin family protein 22
LLAQERTNSGLDLRQNGKEIVVSGATVVNITDMVEFSKQYDIALRNRSTASTKLNQESSRSHFVLQLFVKTQIDEDKYLSSKVHLIDLVNPT